MAKPHFEGNPQPLPLAEANPFPDRVCLNCCWWHKGYTDGPTGHCRRYAPLTRDSRDLPIMFADGWCGDWSEHEVPRLMTVLNGIITTWFWLQGTQRSQDFGSRGAAIEAEGLGTIEWKGIEL